MILLEQNLIKIAYPDIRESQELYNALSALLLENETQDAKHAPIICGKREELVFYKDLFLRGLECIEVPEGEDNIIYAAQELKKGNIHAILAGNISSTGDVVSVGIKEIGMKEGIHRASSYFLMNHPEYGEYIFTDSGLQPDPNAQQLIEIVRLSCENAEKHGISRKVALLSGGVDMPKMQEVAEYFSQSPIEGAEIYGPLSFHEAIEQGCKIFVFPDLNTGNILYKAAERMKDMAVMEQNKGSGISYGYTQLQDRNGASTFLSYHLQSYYPTADELFQVALNSVEDAKKKGIQPRVAFLSFSTAGSGKNFPSILPAREAAQKLATYLEDNNIHDVKVIEEEVQLDTAFLPDTAAKKGIKIEKSSNIYIMPNIYVAQMIGTVIEKLGGSSANGPRFQGFKQEIHDFSRGVGADGIVRSHKTTEKELS